jgi:GH24 family phage-related lysozyme (muramidase)
VAEAQTANSNQPPVNANTPILSNLSMDGKAWFIHPVAMIGDYDNHELQFSAKGIAFLKLWEGLRLKPYDDQTGKTISQYTKGATIGVGHLIVSATEFEIYKNGIDQIAAEKLLFNDLNSKGYIMAVTNNIRVKLKQHEFDALVVFAFNIGINAFKNSTVIKMINNPNGSYSYNTLEEAWLSWSKSQKKFNQGVNNRRRSEYYLFQNGKYTTYNHLTQEYTQI